MKLSLSFVFILVSFTVSMTNNHVSANSEGNDYLLHAESSDRLITIMQKISSLSNNKSIEEPIKLSEEDTIDLIEAVEELLFYAELMSIAVPATELEENKAVVFRAMASQLYDEALNIQQLTRNYDLHITDNSQEHILDQAFVRLSQTCNACHQLFRDK